jgi:murein DD-endopeptidase MepM/ murein hydrolase activator NlpD
MLELAIQNGTDAWGIMASNDLKSSWEALPGDVLRVTGEDNNGPGALPGAIKSVTITGLIQGNTGEIQVNSEDDLSLSGELFNHPLNFFTDSDQLYSTLQGVYAMAVPGLYPLSLDTKLPDGSMHQFSQKVMIRKADFLFDRPLPVDPATLDPETNRSENELWFSATAQATPEKRWAGKLFLPVEPVFGECYSSRFGSRRSYNGSEYLFFHTGLDFCGQVGDPIYAAAPGVVVLATPLTVRGKATIIDHGWGVYTAYLHQSEILVNEGDQVEQGQLIGKVGNTGRVEGPHLHFEVIVGGIQVDPLEWLNKAFP